MLQGFLLSHQLKLCRTLSVMFRRTLRSNNKKQLLLYKNNLWELFFQLFVFQISRQRREILFVSVVADIRCGCFLFATNCEDDGDIRIAQVVFICNRLRGAKENVLIMINCILIERRTAIILLPESIRTKLK